MPTHGVRISKVVAEQGSRMPGGVVWCGVMVMVMVFACVVCTKYEGESIQLWVSPVPGGCCSRPLNPGQPSRRAENSPAAGDSVYESGKRIMEQ